jgi:hypothetical protein
VCSAAQTRGSEAVTLKASKEPFVENARVSVAVALMPEAAPAELPTTVPDEPRVVACPLCHTTHPSLTLMPREAGADWRCQRCGQRWDAGRLATVAEYAAWVAAQDSGDPPC